MTGAAQTDWPPTRPRGTRAGAGPLTRLAERRLARRYGWILPFFQNEIAAPEGSWIGSIYRVTNPLLAVVARDPRVDCVRIAEWLPFANAVTQLKNAFILAQRYGIPRICLPDAHPMFGGEARVAGVTTDGARSARGVGLLGHFLHRHALGLTYDGVEEQRISQTVVRPLLTPLLRQPDPRVGPDDLVLHFRSGLGVFPAAAPKPGFQLDARHIHLAYGQPPLAYYLRAVELANPRRVWLVYWDRASPAIAAAEAALRAKGIEVLVQSGELLDDFRVLLSARRLVGSIGSFTMAVATLSDRLETYYTFMPNPPDVLRRGGYRLVHLRDGPGAYRAAVMQNNWTASDEQLRMMLDYPADAIVEATSPAAG